MGNTKSDYFAQQLLRTAKKANQGFAPDSPANLYKVGKQTALTISCGVFSSPFGFFFIGTSEKKICALFFLGVICFPFPENIQVQNEMNNVSIPQFDYEELIASFLKEIQRLWPCSYTYLLQEETEAIATEIFGKQTSNRKMNVLLCGTSFQFTVWSALSRLEQGAVISYSALARYIGFPLAVRAVASAVASNPVSYIIPCHRVITKKGEIHAYRWGKERKKNMLLWEKSIYRSKSEVK